MFEAPFELTATRNDCQSPPFSQEDVTVNGISRRPRFPCVVRYFVRLHAQECELLHGSPCQIHPLEVCHILASHAQGRDLT